MLYNMLHICYIIYIYLYVNDVSKPNDLYLIFYELFPMYYTVIFNSGHSLTCYFQSNRLPRTTAAQIENVFRYHVNNMSKNKFLLDRHLAQFLRPSKEPSNPV